MDTLMKNSAHVTVSIPAQDLTQGVLACHVVISDTLRGCVLSDPSLVFLRHQSQVTDPIRLLFV